MKTISFCSDLSQLLISSSVYCYADGSYLMKTETQEQRTSHPKPLPAHRKTQLPILLKRIQVSACVSVSAWVFEGGYVCGVMEFTTSVSEA